MSSPEPSDKMPLLWLRLLILLLTLGAIGYSGYKHSQNPNQFTKRRDDRPPFGRGGNRDNDPIRKPPIKNPPTLKKTPITPEAAVASKVPNRLQSPKAGTGQQLTLSRRAVLGKAQYKAVTFTPDQAQIIAVTEDGDIESFSVKTGESIERTQARNVGGESLAMSPYGFELAVSGKKGMMLYDFPSMKTKRYYPGPQEGCALTISPDGRTLAATNGDLIHLIDLHRGMERGSIITTLKEDNQQGRSIAFSPDGRLLAFAGKFNKLVVVDCTDYTEKLRVDIRPGTTVGKVIFSPDGTKITFLCAINDQFQTFDLETGNEIKFFKPDNFIAGNDMAYSPDGTIFVSGGRNRLALWNAKTGEMIADLEAGFTVGKLCFSPDGSALATVGEGESDSQAGIVIWDLVATHQQLTAKQVTEETFHVAFSSDGKTFAYKDKGDVVLYDIAKKESNRLKDFGVRTSYFAFTPDGRSLLVARESGATEVWTLNDQKLQWTIDPKADGIYQPIISADSSRVAFFDGDHIQVWSLTDRKKLAEIPATWGADHFMVFSPDGTKLASNEWWAGDIRIWDITTKKEIRHIVAHENSVGSVAFSPDGTKLISSGSYSDRTLALWEVATGKMLWRIAVEDEAEVVVFSEDGSSILGICENRAIVLDPASGKVKQSHPEIPDSIDVALLSADNKWITVTGDEVMRVWRVSDLMSQSAASDIVRNASSTPESEEEERGYFTDGESGPKSEAYSRVNQTKVSGDGKWILAMANDNNTFDSVVLLWNREEKKLVHAFKSIKPVYGFQISHDGSIIVILGDKVTIWNGKAQKLMHTLGKVKGDVSDLALTRDGKLLAVSSREDRDYGAGEVSIWNIDDGSLVAKLDQDPSGQNTGKKMSISAISFTPDQKRILLSFADGASHFYWDWTSKAITPGPSNESSTCHAFSPDGKMLVTGGKKTIAWRLDGKPADRWMPALEESKEPEEIIELQFTPDGKYLFGIGADSKAARLIVWDVATGKRIQRIDGFANSLAITPDGKYFIAGGEEGAYLQVLIEDLLNQPLQRLADLMYNAGDCTLERKGEAIFIKINVKGRFSLPILAELPKLKMPLIVDLKASPSLGVKGLKQLEGASIRELDLSLNDRITDEAVKTILTFVDLESLDIHRTPMTDAGVKQLVGLKKLKKLTVSRSIMPETREMLQKAISGLVIQTKR